LRKESASSDSERAANKSLIAALSQTLRQSAHRQSSREFVCLRLTSSRTPARHSERKDRSRARPRRFLGLIAGDNLDVFERRRESADPTADRIERAVQTIVGDQTRADFYQLVRRRAVETERPVSAYL